jgi:hypothetical protein
VRSVGGILEITVAVDKKQKHVSISQIGAGRNQLGAIHAVLITERQVPRRVVGHEIEHPGRELVVVDPRVPRRGDRVDRPRRLSIGEELMPFATLPLEAHVDRARRDRRGQCPEVLRRRAGNRRELLEAPVRQRSGVT